MKGCYDAIIVGARVSGAATGLLLARAGARVLILDRDSEIGDTLSTHALMRPTVELLSAWGILEGSAAVMKGDVVAHPAPLGHPSSRPFGE